MTFQKKQVETVPTDTAMEPESKSIETVKMKYMGHFKGLRKVVELPIPLLSNSQKLEETLVFTRTTNKGPAVADVPMEWAGALLHVGGNWQLNEKVSVERQAAIDAAYEATNGRMEQFALDNEMVSV